MMMEARVVCPMEYIQNLDLMSSEEERDRLIAERLSREYHMESKFKLTALRFKG